jgi:carbamoyl-phosphate synthase large subunit
MDRNTLDKSTYRAATRSPAKPARVALGGVLVTGVGGIVGQQVVKSLASSGRRLIGADASEHAAGLYAVDRGYLVPPARDPGYVDRLIEIAAGENARYLFAGLDMELPIFAREAARFRKAGIVPIISSADVIDLGDDKLKTARFLETNGLPSPRTIDLDGGNPRELPFPFVLKPRRGGSRSAGVRFVNSEEELRHWLDRIDATNYVAQEFIAGEEYTCGTITFDGRCHGAIVMRRTLRDGDTHKAFVVRDGGIESLVKGAAELLDPFGPCNFQLRVRAGRPYIFDINPRCSGTTYCRTLAGFNEPAMTLEYLEHGTAPSFEIRPISVLRYWKELVVENSKMEEARRTGEVRGSELEL